MKVRFSFERVRGLEIAGELGLGAAHGYRMPNQVACVGRSLDIHGLSGIFGPDERGVSGLMARCIDGSERSEKSLA